MDTRNKVLKTFHLLKVFISIYIYVLYRDLVVTSNENHHIIPIQIFVLIYLDR